MRRHAPPKPPKAAAPNPSKEEDPFFLCWGSSVNVNEDLRRSIRSEVEDINASIQDLSNQIKGAKSTSLLLGKDLSHAKQEMMGLQQTVKDDWEVATVNREIQDRFGETLMESVVPVASSKEGASMQSNNDTIDASEVSTNNKDDAVVSMTVASSNGIDYKSYITAMTSKKNQQSRSVDTLAESLAESVAYLKCIQEEEEAIAARILRDDLQAAEEAAKKQEEARLEEKRQALQSLRAKKEALQYSRCRSGDYAQQIANNTKALAEKKTKNEALELAKKQDLESVFAKLRNKEKQVAASKQDLDVVSGQVFKVQQQLDLATSLREARSAKKRERQDILDECGTLEAQEKELQTEVATAKAKLLDTAAFLQKAQEEAAAVESAKAKTDEMMAEQQSSGEAELSKLSKEKENLASAMNLLHQKSIETKEANDKVLKEQEVSLEAVRTELKKVQEDLEAATTAKSEAEQALQEAEQESVQEIKQLETLTSNVAKATEAGQARKEEIQQLKKEERKAKLLQSAEEFDKVRTELETTLEVLGQGKELLDATAKQVALLDEEPALADEEQ